VVTITGTNLAGVATVKFGGIASKSLTVLSPTTVTAAVPAGAKTGKISLSTAGGTATSKSTFTVIAAPTQLAAGASHSCARLSNGATACWGANASGQLGNGSTTASSTPLPVPGLAGVTQVAAGGAFSCARLSSGGVKCWGSNTKGQLGRGTLTGSKTPVAVLSTSGALGSAASVATGDAFACAVVAPGPSGTVKCWGQNSSGQLGDGTTTQRTKAVTVLSAKGTPLKGATAIAAGGSTACARLTTGAVRCWGANAHGQLGRGNVAKSSFAVAVTGIDGSAARATALTVGGSHACAVLTTGGVRCWGANSSGQLGDGTTTQRTSPVAARTSRTAALAGVRSISAGGAHTCAITGSGGAARVRCWGSDASGQIGTTATGNAKYATLTSGTVANGATAIAAGGSHTIALSSSTSMPVKALSGWGKNLNGQLGIGTKTSEPTPTRSPTL
jgi:alpha-tubulin suppressor-like RCC1 family protein